MLVVRVGVVPPELPAGPPAGVVVDPTPEGAGPSAASPPVRPGVEPSADPVALEPLVPPVVEGCPFSPSPAAPPWLLSVVVETVVPHAARARAVRASTAVRDPARRKKGLTRSIVDCADSADHVECPYNHPPPMWSGSPLRAWRRRSRLRECRGWGWCGGALSPSSSQLAAGARSARPLAPLLEPMD